MAPADSAPAGKDEMGAPDDAETVLDRARRWLADDPDPTTRRELEELIERGNSAELAELFGGRLQFGTAGLRGILGPGPNRMNRALIRRVGLGLARYLLRENPQARQRGVVVGHDARRLSPELAEDTARVLAGAGIVVHLFEGYAPTPLVAYAVRRLGAAAGVVVTASHNPPEYNGYKVYWDNGAQIIPPHDTGISQSIDAVVRLGEVTMPELRSLRREDLVRTVPEKVAEDYLRDILALQRHPDLARDIDVVYTPMHGVGGRWVEEALQRSGVAHFHRVASQFSPDGEFPTVRFPNPEEEGALDLALDRAREVRADVILANDPDADRLAVAVPCSDEESGYRLLSGNQIGSILGYYLLTENLSADIEPLLMTTIVSSRLLSRMADELGAHYDETLTGFKWIANRSQQHREKRGWELIMGYEEALGYTVGMVTSDKDGISAALLFAEIAAWCKQQEISVLEYLERIYRRFGLHVSRQHSVVLPGAEGAQQIATIMERVRRNPPADFEAGFEVETVTDYLPGHQELPPSNVLAFDLRGGARVLMRPSGTEPKIKYYFELSEELAEGETLGEVEDRAQGGLDRLVEGFLKTLEAIS